MTPAEIQLLAATLCNPLHRDVQQSCAACSTSLGSNSATYDIVYGRPVALCDAECLLMLRANWQPTKGRL